MNRYLEDELDIRPNLPGQVRNRPRPARPRQSPWQTQAGGFDCRHCGLYVCTLPLVSGVQNRNHCPFCLWSRHLDLHTAGDRLSACKAPMRPLGLTVKLSHKKYAARQSGELMLVHQCLDCGKLSINRLAADDDGGVLRRVFQDSLRLPPDLSAEIMASGISLLRPADWPRVERQLVR